jgi:hypothetical protein
MDKTQLSNADMLFARLDSQRISGDAATWITEVLGIFVDGSDAWIQVARAGHPLTNVVLRMSLRGNIERALTALKIWTDFPLESRPLVVEVS